MQRLFFCHSIDGLLKWIIILSRCLHCDTTLVFHSNLVWYEEYLNKWNKRKSQRDKPYCCVINFRTLKVYLINWWIEKHLLFPLGLTLAHAFAQGLDRGSDIRFYSLSPLGTSWTARCTEAKRRYSKTEQSTMANADKKWKKR